jgi:replication factor C subunit 1
LSSIGRDDASDLVKRYGARVTTAPSGKTDYVVLGEGAGASKLEKIEKLNLKTLDEDELFDLIRKRSAGKLPAKAPELVSESKTSGLAPAAIKQSEKTMEQKITEIPPNKNVAPPTTTDLWTVKWAPKKPEDLIGNHSIYEKLKAWLGEWQHGKPSEFNAVLLSGTPGIGKTTMAHMACKQAGYDIVEMNASDTRSKKALHEEVREVINNSSLGSFFKPTSDHKVKKQCIIMDECDGMSAGDRGGMAELIQLIKKTKMPIICACNDRSSPKVRSLANYCMDLRFRKPEARQVVPRITEICRQEGLTVNTNTIEELVASTQGDIRQILNLLSTYRLTHETLNFDESKKLGQASKKDIEEGPFDALHSLLSGQSYSRMTLNQKIDTYFIDSGLMPLMVQENYLKSRANNPRTVYDSKYGGTGASFMTLAWAAADSISKADEVDALIRGFNQEWSLAPLHAIHSCVRPAYFCSGNLNGRVDFAGWLGQNSKQQKYLRILKELTQHLYLNTRANKLTLCMDYAPTMAATLMNNLQSVETIDRAIKFLDDYSIAKEDVESILEIVLDTSCNSQAYSKLPTATKSAFTRKYNQGSHMLPYSLGTSAPVRKIQTDIKAGDDDDGGGEGEDAEVPEESIDGDDEDVSKDKMIKSKAPKAKAPSKRGGKK